MSHAYDRERVSQLCSVCTADFISNIGKEPTDTGIIACYPGDAHMLCLSHAISDSKRAILACCTQRAYSSQ